MTSEKNIIYGGDYPEPKFNSLGELIVHHLKRRSDDVILVNGVTGSQWTSHDILQLSVQIAKSLHCAGIIKNDVVSILSENCVEFISILFGTCFLNALLAPINYNYAKKDLKHSLNLSKPRIIFTSSFALKNIVEVSEEMNYLEQIILLDDAQIVGDKKVISLKQFIESHNHKSHNIEELISKPINMRDQTATIFLSSGTTGVAKGCEITQYNMAVTIDALEEKLKFLQAYQEKVVNLNVSPWFHVMGNVNVFAILLSKSYLCVFLPRHDPKHFLQSIERYKVIATSIPPPVMVFLSKSTMADEFDLSSLRLTFCGGAPLKHETETLIKERFKGITILQGYGLTETTAGIIRGVFGKEAPGTTGMVEKGVYVKVIDEKGNALGPNKVGEICSKGSRNMKGYLNDAKATAETIDKDGWLHTGDLGYYDEDFQFFIVDRLKELIKYRAFQVAPAELEGLLLSNPKIKDCGVIGVPDEVSGELPMAFIVKESNVELTEQEVKDFVQKNASNAKWLRGGVKFIDEIPKNPSGKILRRELRDFYKNMKIKL